MKVNILGTEYDVQLEVPHNEKSLEDLDGYTDDTSKVIVVSDCKDTNYDKPQDYKNKILLHEIVHSFLNECGLAKGTCEWHCEEMVEWCATQMPRIMKAYESIIIPFDTIETQYIGGIKETHQLSGDDIHERYLRGGM